MNPANRLAGVGSGPPITPQMVRVDQEIAACEQGEYGDGLLWLYLLGWADWQTEKELLRQEQSASQAASGSQQTSSS